MLNGDNGSYWEDSDSLLTMDQAGQTELMFCCAPAGPCAHCLDSPSDVLVCKRVNLAAWPKHCYCCLLIRRGRRGGSVGHGKYNDRKLVSRSPVTVWRLPSPSKVLPPDRTVEYSRKWITPPGVFMVWCRHTVSTVSVVCTQLWIL